MCRSKIRVYGWTFLIDYITQRAQIITREESLTRGYQSLCFPVLCCQEMGDCGARAGIVTGLSTMAHTGKERESKVVDLADNGEAIVTMPLLGFPFPWVHSCGPDAECWWPGRAQNCLAGSEGPPVPGPH